MQYTTNYNLNKPELEDPVDIDDLNLNFDTIDAKLKTIEDTLNNDVKWCDEFVNESQTNIVSYEIEIGKEYYFNGSVTDVVFTIAEDTGLTDAKIHISTASTIGTITLPQSFKCIGEDCTGGVWSPVGGKRYTITINYDGLNNVAVIIGYSL